MKLGVDSYSFRNSGLDPVGVLELAANLGLSGVLFEISPFSSFRDDDLARIRETAQRRGLYIEMGMGSILRWHPLAEKGIALLKDAGYETSSDAEIVIGHLEVARKLGSPLLRCVTGDLFMRDQGHDMVAIADQAVCILREACNAATAMGMKIALENHVDFTVRELAGICARVNSPAFGFNVDCANVAFDLDDPLRLVGIMAAHALTTHFKNFRVVGTPQGLALESCPLGDGDIDAAKIAHLLWSHHPTLNLNIEIHSQFIAFPLNILDDEYFTHHPAPPGDGLAWHLKKAWQRPRCEEVRPMLADGQASWDVELEDVKRSIAWAHANLGDILER